MPDVVLPPAAVDLPLSEYKICVQFKDPFSKRPRDWALRLLNQDPLHPLAAACTPLIAGTEEDAVDMMLSEHCKAWGAFTLDQSALVLLLHRRHRSLLEEPAVEETIAKHVPLRRVADAQYRRDILSMWKRHFPGEAERLQPRRCDQALLLPNLQPRAPYKVGWDEWMRVNIHHQQQPTLGHHVKRPVALIGPPTVRAKQWAQLHGPHVYMQGRLDLPYLHDCLADANGAQYVILDELPWSLLLREEGHSHSILTNGTFSWFHGRQLHTTTQHLPVIVLKSHLPNPDDPCWQPRGWLHWKSILQVTKLLAHVPLQEECAIDAADTSVTEGATDGGPAVEVPLLEESAIDAVDTSVTEGAPDTATDGERAVEQLDVADRQKGTQRPRRRSARLLVRSEGEARFLAAVAGALEDEAPAQPNAPPPAPALQLDFARRIPYGPDSFFYPNAIPPSHRQRLLHVVAAIEYVQMRYRGRDLARQKQFQSDNIAGSFAFYEYTGSVPDVWHKGEWSPECLEMRGALREATAEPVNSMVANQYQDASASIDHHSDKTADIKRGTSIWTISLGDTRPFELRKRDGTGTLVVQLTHGSVFQIGPLTNAAYTHSIPPVSHEIGPRYGLTFRTLASRWLHDEQVALRQPTRDGDPWLVQKKVTRLDADGHVVLRNQDGYPSRRVVHLPPFALDDPTRVQETDINRLRERLRVIPPRQYPRPPRARKQKRTSNAAHSTKRQRRRG